MAGISILDCLENRKAHIAPVKHVHLGRSGSFHQIHIGHARWNGNGQNYPLSTFVLPRLAESIDGREIDSSSGFILRHRNTNRFIRRAAHRVRNHAIDRLPGADALEWEFAQELRPHAARAHKFRREQGRALEILDSDSMRAVRLTAGPMTVNLPPERAAV
jgi:hypothetical protein